MMFFMNKRLQRGIKGIFLLAIMFVLVSTIIAKGFSGQTQYDINISNPYHHVDWDTFTFYKGNLHTHTIESDGSLTPSQAIDEYHQLDYDILAITDHNHVTWPWQTYNRNPKALNMIAVLGNELSKGHHMGSYFTSYNSDSADEGRVLSEIGAQGGIAVLFHPGRYKKTIGWYKNLYLQHEHLIGLEVINQGDRYGNDRKTWDQILTSLMPKRPVWGFSNDDLHIADQMGRDFNVFILPELTEPLLKDAIKNGQFYFSTRSTVKNPTGPVPSINRIVVDNENEGSIYLDAENHQEISWISSGKVIHKGDKLYYRGSKNISGYIRAVLTGPGGETFTQPFGVLKEAVTP